MHLSQVSIHVANEVARFLNEKVPNRYEELEGEDVMEIAAKTDLEWHDEETRTEVLEELKHRGYS